MRIKCVEQSLAHSQHDISVESVEMHVKLINYLEKASGKVLNEQALPANHKAMCLLTFSVVLLITLTTRSLK